MSAYEVMAAYTKIKGSPTLSLTSQVAEIALKDDFKMKKNMVIDGFQEKWGPRRQSEWLIKEVTDKKRRNIHVFCVLCGLIRQREC